MTKRISEIYLLETEQWFSEVLRKQQKSLIYSFVFIHYVMNEIDKKVHSMHCGFKTKKVVGVRLVFSKEES